ncbi:hypothetical protein TNCV_4317671 [Trichonephila clavipes]|nr:hypothetical protein TNCV_4317671 [Trichonephila clavipes]
METHGDVESHPQRVESYSILIIFLSNLFPLNAHFILRDRALVLFDISNTQTVALQSPFEPWPPEYHTTLMGGHISRAPLHGGFSTTQAGTPSTSSRS